MAKRKTTRSRSKAKGKVRRSRDPLVVARKRSKNTGGVVVLL